MRQFIFASVFCVLSLVFMFTIVWYAIDRESEKRCWELADQSRQYEGFYYTSSEAEMCNIK